MKITYYLELPSVMISAQPLQWLFKILRIVYRNRIVVKDNEKAEVHRK